MPRLALTLLLCLLITPLSPAAPIAGKVLDPSGHPVKDAQVFLISTSLRATATTQPTQFPTTRSTDQGAFRLLPPTDQFPACIIATAPGYGLAGIPLDNPNTMTGLWRNAAKIIQLTSPVDVTLTFVGPDGNPVPNLGVSLRRVRSTFLPRSSQSPFSQTTDAPGICVFTGLPQGQPVFFSLNDTRFASTRLEDPFPLPQTATAKFDPIHLDNAARIVGRVVIAGQGKPIDNVFCVARQLDGRAVGVGLSDASGRFEIGQLPAGHYSVGVMGDPRTFEAQPLLRFLVPLRNWANISVSAGGVTGIAMELVPAATIYGRVTRPDGSAVPNVDLTATADSDPNRVTHASTDIDGAFTFRLPEGKQTIRIAQDIDGFPGSDRATNIVTATLSAPTFTEFRLQDPAQTLTGKVLGPDGKPVPGAIISLSAADRPPPPPNAPPNKSDANGDFTVDLTNTSGQIGLRAQFQQLVTPRATLIDASNHTPLTLKLAQQAIGRATGRVVDEHGKPMPDAEITLTFILPPSPFGQSTPAGVTGPDGRFTIDSLWPDATYFLQVAHPGYGRASRPLQLNLGPNVSFSDIALKKRDSTISGTALTVSGKPLANSTIIIFGQQTGGDAIQTDGAGKFSESVVSGDRLEILIPSNGRMGRQLATAGDTSVIVRQGAAQNTGRRPRPRPSPLSLATMPPPVPDLNVWSYVITILSIGAGLMLLLIMIAIRQSHRRRPFTISSPSPGMPGEGGVRAR